MTFEEFDRLTEARLEAVRLMRDTKGKEYTAGSRDRLANFKRSALKSNVSVFQAWHVLFDKHLGSIESFVKCEQTFSDESMRSRITDCITYLLLFEGLISDKEASEGTVLPYKVVKCPICNGSGTRIIGDEEGTGRAEDCPRCKGKGSFLVAPDA